MPLLGYEAIVRKNLKDRGVMIPDNVSLLQVSKYCKKRCIGVCFGGGSLYEKKITIHGIFCEETIPYEILQRLQKEYEMTQKWK